MQKSKKIVLFDIDHTLFNTESYRKKLYKTLGNELGLTGEEHFEDLNNKYLETKKDFGHFKPDKFLKKILKIAKRNTTLETLKSVFDNSHLINSSLFPDVKRVLQQLEKMDISIGIFSSGSDSYQRKKISGIKNYLNENHIYIVPDKFSVLTATLNQYKNYQTFLVDDFPQVLKNVKIHNKNVFTVFMQRKESYPFRVIPKNFKPDATITNLSQLIAIIKTTN